MPPSEEREVIEALRELGLPDQAIDRAIQRGDPESAIFDAVLMPAMAERTVAPRTVEKLGGPTVDELTRLWEAFGLPVPAPDEPAFTPSECEVFMEMKRLQDVWPLDLGIQVSRVYGRLLARIAQAELQMFQVHTRPRIEAEGGDRLTALKEVHSTFARLLPMSGPLLLGVHRRWVEHELAQAAVSETEASGGFARLPGAVEVSFLFCDLKDFSRYADERGDEAAVAEIDRFMDVVLHERGEAFRFQKTLGDGVMLSYGKATEAVAAGHRIVEAMNDPDRPGIHSSVHHGVAIAREGDYFGRSVNLAARLLNAAARDELVATADAVAAAGDDFKWEPHGTLRVRGFADPIEVFRLAGPA